MEYKFNVKTHQPNFVGAEVIKIITKEQGDMHREAKKKREFAALSDGSRIQMREGADCDIT